MATSRFIDWLTSLTQKSTTIDGTEITHIGSSGLSQKATTKDLVSYVSQNLAQVWNAAGTVFTAIKMNVTDTASSASSLLMDLQVGGSSKFRVDKTGRVSSGAGYVFAKPQFWDSSIGDGAGFGIGNANSCVIYANTSSVMGIEYGSNGIRIADTVSIGWTSGHALSSAPDPRLYRDTTGVLAQRNGTNAQEWRVYGTYTDASNYRRLTYKMSTAGVAELKPEGAGTGASGNVLHISGLPTSNPGPGILWNDAGTIKVGT